MKRFFVVFSLFLMLLTENLAVAAFYDTFYGEEGTPPNCAQFTTPGCPRDLNPVCGTDSLTYSNECELCEKIREQGKDIKIKSRGPCFLIQEAQKRRLRGQEKIL